QRTVPSARRAHVWKSPQSICVAPFAGGEPAGTGLGTPGRLAGEGDGEGDVPVAGGTAGAPQDAATEVRLNVAARRKRRISSHVTTVPCAHRTGLPPRPRGLVESRTVTAASPRA